MAGMITELSRRGFYSDLVNYYRNNFYRIRSEPLELTKCFDQTLRNYIEIKPLEVKIGKSSYDKYKCSIYLF